MKPLELEPHPEGGRFREVFRSAEIVTRNCGTKRTAITHIYFSLSPGEVSRFHRVESDEIWNLYEGEGVRIHQWQEGSDSIETIELTSESRNYCHVVPAGYWQATEPIGSKTLVGCSVGPGFDFADFALIDPESDTATKILTVDKRLQHLL